MTNREKVDYINSQLKPEDLLLLLAAAAENASHNATKLREVIMSHDFWATVSLESMESSWNTYAGVNDVHLFWHILNQSTGKNDVIPWETTLSVRENKRLNELVKHLKEAEGHDEQEN